ncbi:DASS family sodium-coupled anion symporter [Corynebacterium sp. USCH3]|uniref:SLC13 family permease n=1 Tax=Corynebacterium sp. USCH3 TaxID=3024840 RepID=UPI0030AC2369
MESPSGSPRTNVADVLLRGGTYRSLEQQQLSPMEEKFEKFRRISGFILAPLGFILMLTVPGGMDPTQQKVAAVLVGVILLWLCESLPIPVTGLLGVGMLVLIGTAPAAEVLAPFGSTTIFTFIGAFILAQAMLKHGVAQRVAYFVLGLPGVGTSTVRIILAFGGITCALSAFVSNTATVAMLLPTALGILTVIAQLMQDKGIVKEDFDPMRLRVGAALMLMLAYGASIGGLLTPVGAPPNLIGRGLIEEATGERISFGQWVMTAAPICACMLVALTVILFLVNRPETRRIDGVAEFIAERKKAQGKMSRAEINTVIAFSVTVFLWIFPAVLGMFTGVDSPIYEVVDERLNEGIVAVLGAVLLFILPVKPRQLTYTLDWSDAAKIDWGTILLFGSGMIFGAMLGDSGLATSIGEGLNGMLGVSSGLVITAMAVILAIIISETTSNTAAAAVTVPIVVPLAVAAGVDPVIPAMAATFGASFGFMLPISTPQNAIVYGSGCVSIGRMVRTGISFDIIGAVLIVLFLPWVASLVGIGG